MQLTDEQLIEAARGGDSAAFDHLVTRHQDQLYRLMVRACHHPDDAEEVAVEALARAYEKLEQFEGRSSFVTWLGRIGQNLCFRRRGKKEVPTESLEDEIDAAPLNETSPEQQAMQAEMRRILRAAVNELPEPDQSVLRLRDIENLSAAETAAQLKISVPAVKSRLHRARAQLRAKLNAYFCVEE